MPQSIQEMQCNVRVFVNRESIDEALPHKVVELHELMNHACSGRHQIIPIPSDAFDNWFHSLDDASRSAYEKALEMSIRDTSTAPSNASTVYIEKIAQPSWEDPVARLQLSDALRLMSAPLNVLVENANNDWAFVLRMLKTSERERFDRAVAKGWLEKIHGGGSNLVDRILERVSVPHRLLRTFAVFDSDRRHPDELMPEWAPTSPEKCQGHATETVASQHLGDRYWRLTRRSIESYLPAEELIRFATGNGNVINGAAEAYLAMPKEAQWYYNMKKGFEGDRNVQDAHRCKTLYTEVPEISRQLLNNGFGRSLADRYVTSESVEFKWDVDAKIESATAISNLLRMI